MSIKIELNNLTIEDKSLITKKLKFEKKRTNYNKFQNIPTIRPYLIETSQEDNKDYIYLPFYWSQKYFKDYKRPSRKKFPAMKTSFKGTLRPLQEEVQLEAIQIKKVLLLYLYILVGVKL